MDFIRHAHTQRPGQPWFVQLWLNAPHSPWTEVRSGSATYEKELQRRGEKPLKGRTCPDLRGPMALGDWRPYQYKTMVASMDASIGWIMAQLRDMGLDNNTIVVFTSDNGPEAGAGAVNIN
jgi:arylsulfatase A-like enzyme